MTSGLDGGFSVALSLLIICTLIWNNNYSQTSPYVNLSKMESLLGCQQNAYKYSYKNTPTIQTPDTKL